MTLFALDRMREEMGAAGPSGLALAAALAARLRPDDRAWIGLDGRDEILSRASSAPSVGPLAGAPFAVKDNIDVAGIPTTAGCPAFSSVPARSATAVQRLLDAGAWLAGKTNLDQFATGLVGTRSPYGAVPNPFDAAYISGGSSSGSASVVARGLAAFSLGTDTAGSGRVPAAFCNIVGLKPTRGLVSTAGVLPACRSLDCISIFALTASDAGRVLDVMAGDDPADPYSRCPTRTRASFGAAPRLAIPREPEFFGDARSRAAFEAAVKHAESLGAVIEPVDFSAFHEAAALLYEGPWVAERLATLGDFLAHHPNDFDPAVRSVIESGAAFSAADAFRAAWRLEWLRRETQAVWSRFDALFVPSAPTIYRHDEIAADPLRLNARLGTYTNFVNLLDLAAIALPAGFRDDHLPFGITVIAPAGSDRALIAFGDRWQRSTDLPLGATAWKLGEKETTEGRRPGLDPGPTEWIPAYAGMTNERRPGLDPGPIEHGRANAGTIRIAVVGAHLRGQPLNHQLASRNARFVGEAQTAERYRLYALPATTPAKPGLVRTHGHGLGIALELWDLSIAEFGSFVAEVPPPLGIGSVELADGQWVKGFVCESHALEGAEEISKYGGWRAYLAARAATHPVS